MTHERGDDGTEFVVERSHGSAHDFHHRPLELVADQLGGRAAIWAHEVARPAIVLGSSQRDDIVDRAAAESAGWEVSGRRSGGGIVVVEPGESCWIDVVIGRSHPRWDDDVNRAFGWVGEWWRTALARLGVAGLSVHEGELLAREHGRAVCFAGLGPGEVITAHTGRKIVGLSQRRTRDLARFQGLYLRRWNPEPIQRFVRPESLPADLDLGAVAAGFGDQTSAPEPASVVESFILGPDDPASGW